MNLLSLLTILSTLYIVHGEDLTVLPIDVAKDKEVICDAAQRADADCKVDITSMMDYDDLLRLTVWNSKYNLKAGEKAFAFPNLDWKRTILTQLQSIFTAACPPEIVPPGFINVARELFMIYQNSMSSNSTDTAAANGTDHSQAWQAFTAILSQCLTTLERFNMNTEGFKASGIKLTTKVGHTEDVTLLPPIESADASPDIDLIVDTIWWLFSFSFGSCYWSSTNPSIWASRYKRLFYADFLNNLKTRWLHAGPETDFGVIFGDFNLPVVVHNIRACVTAAYVKNGLADRQLVRSITLAPSKLGIDAGLNKKVGDAI